MRNKSNLPDKMSRVQAAMSNGELASYELAKPADKAAVKTASWGPAMRV
jgi:hypothetical protein